MHHPTVPLLAIQIITSWPAQPTHAPSSPCPFPHRYDKLVGMFSGKEVPAVGVSIGIERVFAIMEAQLRAQAEAVSLGLEACFAWLTAGKGKGVPSWRPSRACRRRR